MAPSRSPASSPPAAHTLEVARMAPGLLPVEARRELPNRSSLITHRESLNH
jgi:hypothetical protein